MRRVVSALRMETLTDNGGAPITDPFTLAAAYLVRPRRRAGRDRSMAPNADALAALARMPGARDFTAIGGQYDVTQAAEGPFRRNSNSARRSTIRRRRKRLGRRPGLKQAATHRQDSHLRSLRLLPPSSRAEDRQLSASRGRRVALTQSGPRLQREMLGEPMRYLSTRARAGRTSALT